MAEHGTYAAVNRHNRSGEPLCESCREFRREYMREFRATHPGYLAANAMRTNARRRAMTRLAAEYPRRFEELLDDELAPATSAVNGSPEAPLTALIGEADVVGSPARTAQATGARAVGLSKSANDERRCVNSGAVETTTS